MLVTIRHASDRITGGSSLLGIARHSSILLNAISEGRYYWSGVGSLSFKFAIQGESRYRVDNRYLLADNSNFLVLNHGQPYEVEIESRVVTETFCVFFGQPLVSDVIWNRGSTPERRLEVDAHSYSPEFFQGTRGVSRSLLTHLDTLRRLMKTGADAECVKEELHLFLADLIGLDNERFNQADRLVFLKKSTRDELLKRLLIARDYACAMYHRPVTLEELANVACLSPNHLLRSFKQLYGSSPIQYLNWVRLQKAKMLLKQSNFSIQEVCNGIGYSSLGTFSSTFKRSTGLTPTEFRSGKGDFE